MASNKQKPDENPQNQGKGGANDVKEILERGKKETPKVMQPQW